MVIELCRCGWEIPGVESLPPHQHFDRTLVTTNYVREPFWIPTHNVAINSDRLHFLERWVGITVSIDWQRVARELMTEQAG